MYGDKIALEICVEVDEFLFIDWFELTDRKFYSY